MNAASIAKALLAALAVFGLAAPAGASVIAYQVPAGTAGTQSFGGELGMEFNVLWPITVSELGVFDDGSNGLSRNLTARLWDRTSTGTPLATLSFTTADPGTLAGGSRFKPLATPLSLPAGFQGTISASGYGSGEQNGNSGGAAPVWTTDGAGALSFVGSSRWGNTPGAYPPNADTGPANRYAAGTFVFDAVGVLVTNGSFEIPDVGDGLWSTSVPNWTFSGDAGVFNPQNGQFPGSTGDPGTDSLPTPADGHQHLYINTGEATQTVGLIEDNTIYTLDVAVGDRLEPGVAGWTVELRSGTDTLAQLASTDPGALNPAAGTFVGNTLEWDASGSPFVGQLMNVALIRLGTDGQGAFDNVRISAAAAVIPEPATLLIWSLLAGLGIGVGYRRRVRSAA